MATETRAPAGSGTPDVRYRPDEQDVRPGERSADDVSVREVLRPLVRHRRMLLGVPVACALLAGAVGLILPSTYKAETTMTPVTTASLGGLTGSALASLVGLAGQLGVSSGSGGAISPDFFAEVLKSRELLTATLESRFRDAGADGAERPLLEILRVKGRTAEERLGRGVRELTKRVKTRVDRATGIVSLEVTSSNPQLSADVANRMREILNTFNLERRQSQSREQARFARERVAAAEVELREAERAQLRFLQANRQYIGSPLLEFQAGQLQRAVDLKQEVYVSLAKSYEEARIAEVRDTPVITTIDSATAPYRRSSPRPVLMMVIALLGSGVLCLFGVYALEQRARMDREPLGASPQPAV